MYQMETFRNYIELEQNKMVMQPHQAKNDHEIFVLSIYTW